MRDLEDIMLREVNQTAEDYGFTYMWHLKDKQKNKNKLKQRNKQNTTEADL